MEGNAGMVGRRCDVLMHETCYCGRFKPVKKSLWLTYGEKLQVTRVKKEIMAKWGGSQVKELLL